MNTFDTILKQAEKLAGPGFHVSILVERASPGERQPGVQGATSDQPLLNVRQLAEMLGKSPATIRARCKDGTLPASKIGRSWFVSRAALEQIGRTKR